MITVFTPTYNRGNLLNRLYQSLCKQNYKEFEWIIVDDGSLDDTSSIVNIIQDKHPYGDFSILYYKKENGGKHTAVNTGVQKAHGDLFFIADSDDILPPNALQTVAGVWEQTKYDNSIGGICGFDGDINDGSLIGTGFPKEVHLLNIELSNHINIGYIDATTRDVRFKLKVDGDMKEVFRTSVLREFPFPEIEGEKFCPEVLVWNRIAYKYKLRYFNEAIYIAEYQPEGLTARIVEIRMKSPTATTTCYAEMVSLDIPFKDKIKAAINYWRFRLCCKEKTPAVKIGRRWKSMFFLGWMMHMKDLRMIRQK